MSPESAGCTRLFVWPYQTLLVLWYHRPHTHLLINTIFQEISTIQKVSCNFSISRSAVLGIPLITFVDVCTSLLFESRAPVTNVFPELEEGESVESSKLYYDIWVWWYPLYIEATILSTEFKWVIVFWADGKIYLQEQISLGYVVQQ